MHTRGQPTRSGSWAPRRRGAQTSRSTCPDPVHVLIRVRVGGTALFTMKKAEKKKTTALREASMPQPRTAQPCRCRRFGWPLPRTHAHLFARRWLGACIPPPIPPAKGPEACDHGPQLPNGSKEVEPFAGDPIISTCADAAMPKAALKISLTTCVCMTPLSFRPTPASGPPQDPI